MSPIASPINSQTSITLTGGGDQSLAYIRLLSSGASSGEFDVWEGKGAPGFTPVHPSVYYRNDPPDIAHEVYVNVGNSASWTPLNPSANVVSVAAGIGVSLTGTATNPTVNVLAQNGSGALLTGFHIERGSVLFSAASSVAVSLTGSSQFSSSTSYAVSVSTPNNPTGSNTWVFPGSLTGSGFTLYALNMSTGAASSITQNFSWVAAGT